MNENVRPLVVALAVLAALGSAVPAHADPTPSGPGYQIPGPSGPLFPGAQTYAPRCAAYPPACGLRFDPGTQTWNPQGTDSP